MFPSPNCNNPFESLERIRSSSHGDTLFNYPSAFLEDHQSPLNQIFLQNGRLDEIPPRRRRAGKKDRHSKICTAQGIRDRRMRLSLQVARKFFDLQDMLGYDKASKTIEWLFTQSNKAIKELVKSESFLSDCEFEDLSGIEEITAAAAPKPDAKASREKARARARWRTSEKMLLKRLHFQPNPSYDIVPFQQPNPHVPISCPSSDSTLMGIFGNWDFFTNEGSNCFQYSVANQAGNLNSVAEFP